jgi:hypothetical protein
MSASSQLDLSGLAQVCRRLRTGLAHARDLGSLDLPDPRALVVLVAAMDNANAEESWAAVSSVWQHEAQVGEWSPESARKYTQQALRFIRHAALNGHTTLDDAALDAEEWVFSAVRRGNTTSDAAVATLRLRRATIRALYVTARSLGLATARPLRDLELPLPDAGAGKRPVDDDEMLLLRETADTQRGTRAPVCLALGRCGAGTIEMGQVLTPDINLEDRTLLLRGSSRIGARTVRIWNDWDFEVIEHWLATHFPDLGTSTPTAPLLATDREHDVQSAMSASLSALITDARLNARNEITPNSVRAWSGLRVLRANDGDLFATAAYLGYTSLDKTIALLNIASAEQRAHVFKADGPGLVS